MSGPRRMIGPTFEPDSDTVGPTHPHRMHGSSPKKATNEQQPKRKMIGPTFEPNDNNPTSTAESTTPTTEGTASTTESSSTHDNALAGPAPPPKRKIIGPALDEDDTVIEGPLPPPNYSKPANAIETKKRGSSQFTSDVPVGPPRPGLTALNDLEDEDQDKKLRASEWDSVKRTAQVKTTKREEWMTELPPERSSNATALITNRQFSKKDNATTRGDTSLWTASPAEREQKKQKTAEGKTDASNLKEIASKHFASQKDDANLKVMEHHNKKYRSKTLVEEHQEALKKKQSESKSDEPMWKPFDRTTDLGQQVSDPHTAAKIIQNAQTLNSRFGNASNKRFL